MAWHRDGLLVMGRLAMGRLGVTMDLVMGRLALDCLRWDGSRWDGSALRWTSRCDSLRWDGLLGQRRWQEIDKFFRSLKAESLGLKLQLEKKTYSIIFDIRSPKFEYTGSGGA